MDEFDRAQEVEAAQRDAWIDAARRRQAARPAPTGLCLAHCGEEVDPPRLFCGPECAENFELMMRRKGR